MDLEEPVAFKAKITQTDMFTRIGVSKIMTLKQASKETKKVHKEVREVSQEPIHLAIKLDENTQILDEIYNIVRQNAGNRELKITIISKLQNVVIDSAIRVDSNIIKMLEGNTAVDIL
jgi:DNA polymerase-3 subunit alpha